jgi:hypothetical protein
MLEVRSTGPGQPGYTGLLSSQQQAPPVHTQCWQPALAVAGSSTGAGWMTLLQVAHPVSPRAVVSAAAAGPAPRAAPGLSNPRGSSCSLAPQTPDDWLRLRPSQPAVHSSRAYLLVGAGHVPHPACSMQPARACWPAGKGPHAERQAARCWRVLPTDAQATDEQAMQRGQYPSQTPQQLAGAPAAGCVQGRHGRGSPSLACLSPAANARCAGTCGTDLVARLACAGSRAAPAAPRELYVPLAGSLTGCTGRVGAHSQ